MTEIAYDGPNQAYRGASPTTATAAGEIAHEIERLEKLVETLGLELDAAHMATGFILSEVDPLPETVPADKRQSPASEMGRRLDSVNNRLEDRISTLRNMTRRVAL
jgi:hypothetical protein